MSDGILKCTECGRPLVLPLTSRWHLCPDCRAFRLAVRHCPVCGVELDIADYALLAAGSLPKSSHIFCSKKCRMEAFRFDTDLSYWEAVCLKSPAGIREEWRKILLQKRVAARRKAAARNRHRKP